MRTLVIIPAYNEAENIENTIKDIGNYCPLADCLVINDCSTDKTRSLLQGMNVNYIDLPINLGIGGGVQTGYKYALEYGYDIAVQFDGDGQHMAKYIEALLRPVELGEANFVIGSRFVENKGFQSSAARRFGIGFLSTIIKMLCGVKILDVTSGFRAADRKMIKLFANNYAQDYPEPEAIITAVCNGAIVKEIPVQMRERQGGTSSITPIKSIYYMLKVSLALIISRIAS